MVKDQQVVRVGQRTLLVSNLDKVLYPQTGTTKGDVIAYYASVAEFMIPLIKNRPATRKRWVHGVGTEDLPGKVFFQKSVDSATPDWVHRGQIQHRERPVTYPLVNDQPTLIWLAQMAALEIHVPQWQFSSQGVPLNPDRFVLDLDPGPHVGLIECAQVAALARTLLQGMGLEPVPVTSGSKGIHLYAPLDGTVTSSDVSAVAHELARALEADHKDLVVSDMKRSLRVGKVFVDWSQNSAAKTTVAPYSLRGRPQPTVAAPRTWRELESTKLGQITLDEMRERLKTHDSLLTAFSSRVYGTQDAAPVPTDDVERDRLTVYRNKRNAAATPEPIPAATVVHEIAQEGPAVFVIQEHHARRLHYDFRLEHDGVLVSWAIPKGPPLKPNIQRLAVRTEDHPLEYGAFCGTIPAGQYGAGTVSIWDSGTIAVEKWHEGHKIIATLTGSPTGGLQGVPRRFVLVRMKTQENNETWLLQLTETTADQETVTPAGIQDEKRRYRPMLASAGRLSEVLESSAWTYEVKWDGYRVLVYIRSGTVHLLSRNGTDLTASFPEIVAAIPIGVTSHDAILDGELVILDKTGKSNFSLLQQRLGHGVAQRTARQHSATLMLFDALEISGQDLTGHTLVERRQRLEAIVAGTTSVRLSQELEGDPHEIFAGIADLGLEGMVAKRRASTYVPADRSKNWVKIKLRRTQEVVIVGWSPNAQGDLASLLLAVPDTNIARRSECVTPRIDAANLRYVGRVGSGLSESEREQLPSRLTAAKQPAVSVITVPKQIAATAHWVTPSCVGEVEYGGLTSSGQLRQATWRGWRRDKALTDIYVEDLT